MDLELVKFINSDLTWNGIKKGHRSMIRRPRRPGASSSELGFCYDNKMQDTRVLDYEKSGVAILGQHFAEEILEVPIKKRILRLQSPSLSGEGARSPQPQFHSSHREEPELLVASKHASGEPFHSNLPSNICAMKSKSGLSDSEHAKLIEKEVSAMNDFSGIELLAAAACHISVYDSSGHLEPSAMEEHTQATVDLYADGIKEDIAPMDSDDSSFQDDTFPETQNLCDNGNGRDDGKSVPSKGVRLHWDLNTMMDEWEEPPCDIHVDPHSEKGCLRDVYSDGLQSSKANLEVYETRIGPVPGGEHETILHSVRVDQSGKHEAAVSLGPLSKPKIFGIQENNDDDSFGRTYVAEDITSSKEVVGAITCKTSDAESCLSKSDVVDSFVHPTKCEIVSTSIASLSLGQTIIKVASNLYFEPSNKSDDRQTVSEVVQGGCLSLKGDGDDKVTSEDRLSDCCGSNVSQDERGHMAEGNTTDKVKAGYDSPVEDGELREPIRYPWQTNEGEERECVDYESDNTYEDNFDTIESVKNEITLDHHQEIGALGAVSKNDIGHDDNADTCNGSDHLLGSKASEYLFQEHSHCDILEDKNDDSGKFLPVRNMVHDEFHGRNLLSDDRSVSFGARRDGAITRQSRFDNLGDSYSRGERDFCPQKFMGRYGPFYQGRARNDASGPWGDSSIEAWDSRNNHGYPRPKNVIGGSARSGGSSCLDNNLAINYNPRGIQRTFNTRPSSSDRNESFGIHRGTSPARGINRDRGRGGSGFHLQGMRRAPQEYIDPEPCYSERRVPCFSPNFSRGAHLSRSRRRSRSKSRSRSGSPIAWHFLKRRNVDTKRQSPDYRSDKRFEGDRFPFRQPNSSGEIEAGLVPLTRGRVSPQRISRNFDDRNVVNGRYRDRRSSPVRISQRNQRFEAGGFLGRLKSNDHFSTPRPGRFSQATGPSREDFEANSKDSMIRGDKYRMMNGGRPFRYAVDESYKTCNTRDKDNGYIYARDETRCFKDQAGRDVHENTCGEKHH